MQIILFFALFISVLAVIFAIQNNSPVTVSFVAWEFPGSLALFLLIALAAGALISFLFSLPSNVKTRWTIRQQRKKIGEMENNISSLEKELNDVYKKASESKIEQPSLSPSTDAAGPSYPSGSDAADFDAVEGDGEENP